MMMYKYALTHHLPLSPQALSFFHKNPCLVSRLQDPLKHLDVALHFGASQYQVLLSLSLAPCPHSEGVPGVDGGSRNSTTGKFMFMHIPHFMIEHALTHHLPLSPQALSFFHKNPCLVSRLQDPLKHLDMALHFGASQYQVLLSLSLAPCPHSTRPTLAHRNEPLSSSSE